MGDMAWKASEFCGDWDETIRKGYHRDDQWNGWACPAFTLEEANRIMSDQKSLENDIGYFTFDKQGDKFVLHRPTYEPEEFKGFDIDVDGKTVHVYAIGAYSWTWSLHEEYA